MGVTAPKVPPIGWTAPYAVPIPTTNVWPKNGFYSAVPMAVSQGMWSTLPVPAMEMQAPIYAPNPVPFVNTNAVWNEPTANGQNWIPRQNQKITSTLNVEVPEFVPSFKKHS